MKIKTALFLFLFCLGTLSFMASSAPNKEDLAAELRYKIAAQKVNRTKGSSPHTPGSVQRAWNRFERGAARKKNQSPVSPTRANDSKKPLATQVNHSIEQKKNACNASALSVKSGVLSKQKIQLPNYVIARLKGARMNSSSANEFQETSFFFAGFLTDVEKTHVPANVFPSNPIAQAARRSAERKSRRQIALYHASKHNRNASTAELFVLIKQLSDKIAYLENKGVAAVQELLQLNSNLRLLQAKLEFSEGVQTALKEQMINLQGDLGELSSIINALRDDRASDNQICYEGFSHAANSCVENSKMIDCCYKLCEQLEAGQHSLREGQNALMAGHLQLSAFQRKWMSKNTPQ